MKCNSYKILLFVMGVIAVLCFLCRCTYENCIEKEYDHTIYRYQTTLQSDSLWRDSVIKGIVDMPRMIERIDSIANKTSVISNRYQEDVNLMIYKTTQWLSFWLTVITVIAGVIFVFQYFDRRRVDDTLRELEKELIQYKKDTTNELHSRVREYLNGVNDLVAREVKGRLPDIEPVRKDLKELNGNIAKSEKEIRISTLVTCISSFPQPAMFGTGTNKQRNLKYYLRNLYSEYEQYIKYFKEDEYSIATMSRLSVIFVSIKYVVVHTQNIFPDYHQNITFYSLLRNINKVQRIIVSNPVNKEDLIKVIDNITALFGKMVRDI